MAGSERHLRDLIPEIKEMIVSTSAGLNAKVPLEQTKPGLGGSYYMPDASRKHVAVFKPLDEEPKAVNNPEQQQSEGSFVEGTPEGLKKGTEAGKGGYREAAAYLLDHPISGPRSVSGEPKGFAGVPPTTFGYCRNVRFKNPEDAVNDKFGSLQMYMENDGDCAEAKINSYVYNKFPKDQVHKIAVLDIRFANADRHGGNILRSESNGVLIPIDHGYCFPKSGHTLLCRQ